MEIRKVIEQADGLYPNPYTVDEKCRWCDELTAMLTREYIKPYATAELFAESGELLLTEGVDMKDVERVMFAGRVIPKRDMRALGVKILHRLREKNALLLPASYTGKVQVSYLEEAEPIRNIDISDVPIVMSPNSFLTELPIFCEGDVLKITADGITYDDVYVFETSLTDEGYVVAVQEDALADMGQVNANIVRYLTDETACPAPYDVMYVHFICAKVSYYQHDYETYNQNMALVNVQIDAFARHIKERAPIDNDGQFVNWW